MVIHRFHSPYHYYRFRIQRTFQYARSEGGKP
jgi:hypothetical protein